MPMLKRRMSSSVIKYEQLELSSLSGFNDDGQVSIPMDSPTGTISKRQRLRKIKCNKRKAIMIVLPIIFCTILIISIIILFVTGSFDKVFKTTAITSSTQCKDSCCIFCYGSMLQTVQTFNFWDDSKVKTNSHFICISSYKPMLSIL